MASEHRQIGPYRLASRLGRGGNATVWRATHFDTSDQVALKLMQRPNDLTAYSRFKREVEAVARLGHVPGVLPLLDSHLPETPSDSDLPWLAMPIAQPLYSFLGPRPTLSAVVEAVWQIAITLAELAERDIAHRDIKPGNLYGIDGRAAVGDFGLVQLPDDEPITTDARALGPRNFHAPEMFTPAGVDGRPADVYSLAKTLWVLAADQRIPPLGEQRRDVVGPRLSDLVLHPEAPLLDGLIERSTQWDPALRPSMSEVVDELSAWMRLQETQEPENGAPSADTAMRILAMAAPGITAQEAAARHRTATTSAWEEFRTMVLPAVEELARTSLPVQYQDLRATNHTMYQVHRQILEGLVHEQTEEVSEVPPESPYNDVVEGSCAVVEVGFAMGGAMLWSGAAVLGNGPTAAVVAGYSMRLPDSNEIRSISHAAGRGELGSAVLRDAMSTVATVHRGDLDRALSAFADALADFA